MDKTIWKSDNQEQSKWLLVKQLQQDQQHQIISNNNSEKEQSNQKQKEPSGVFVSNQYKIYQKGIVVYTPNGYGITQNYNEKDKSVEVKLTQTQQRQIYSTLEVESFVQINLKIPLKNSFSQHSIIIPAYSTLNNLFKKVEKELSKPLYEIRLLYKGHELHPTTQTLDQLNITPNTQIILIKGYGKLCTLSRFTHNYYDWEYENFFDGIEFKVSKNIKIAGFGIYLGRNYDIFVATVRFGYYKNNNSNDDKIILHNEDNVFLHNQNNDDQQLIYKYMFKKPIDCTAELKYSIEYKVTEGISYYGEGGKNVVTGEKDVVFTFSYLGQDSPSDHSYGQIPEIYYYVS